MKKQTALNATIVALLAGAAISAFLAVPVHASSWLTSQFAAPAKDTPPSSVPNKDTPNIENLIFKSEDEAWLAEIIRTHTDEKVREKAKARLDWLQELRLRQRELQEQRSNAAVNRGTPQVRMNEQQLKRQRELEEQLSRVAANRNMQQVRMLLAAGASGGSALGSAVHANDVGLVKFLLAAGIDADAEAGRGSTALHCAARQWQLETVKILLAAGADARKSEGEEMNGFTALHYAVGETYPGRIQPKEYRGAEEKEYLGDPKEFLEVVKILIAAGADVNAKDKNGSTVLHSAARSAMDPDKAVVTKWIGDGKWTGKGKDVQVPKAVWEAKLDVIKILLAAGADVNAKGGDWGYSALHLALTSPCPCLEAIKILMAAGADVNAKTNGGQTILMHAVAYVPLETINDLLAAGADARVKADGGLTALHNAAQAAGTYRPGTTGGRGIKELVAAGADVNAQITGEGRSKGQTPLFWAVGSGDIGAVKALLDAGADIYIKDANGNTSYDYAKKYRKPEVVKLLGEAMGLSPDTIAEDIKASQPTQRPSMSPRSKDRPSVVGPPSALPKGKE